MKKPKKSKSKKDFSKLDIEKQIKLIHKALEPEVYPALQMHGGGVEIMDIKGIKVFIRYYGACQGCPLASTSTLQFIEDTLQSKIDKKIQVIPV